MFAIRNEVRAQYFNRQLGMDGDWVDNFVESLREIAEWQSNQRGLVAMRNAMRSSPSLWQLRMQYLDRTVDQIAHYLNLVDPDFSGDQEARARIIVETVSAIVDSLQIRHERWPGPLAEELIKMMRAYLRSDLR